MPLPEPVLTGKAPLEQIVYPHIPLQFAELHKATALPGVVEQPTWAIQPGAEFVASLMKITFKHPPFVDAVNDGGKVVPEYCPKIPALVPEPSMTINLSLASNLNFEKFSVTKLPVVAGKNV
jgi:hypothetical protein